ncbi:MAG: 5-oxoprolinase subunit PxpB [Chitinophagaceae bacterium]|nr:5-oxoprolinase subunit PxpB [Chitinophagaceae bacterium]
MISALSETALLVSFDNAIDDAINETVIALQQAFTADFFTGFIETVPAYSSLAVFYDAVAIRKYHPGETTAFDFVKKHTERLMAGLVDTVTENEKELITVPVYYNGDDLDEVAGQHKISVEELVHIHAEKIYRVFMIGFQPGFAYMGKLDERIATARKASPRTMVPAGSVGIAGFQTGIYPFSSPGGWQLIGQTPSKIFDKEQTTPCLFKAGDYIKFISISKEEFEQSNEH